MVEPVYGRWGPTEVMERVLDGTWAEVVDGMALIEPASIVFSGTSAAIVGLGSVEFSAVTSLSLNGVFSSLFDNYMVVFRYQISSGAQAVALRFRASGVDFASSNYTVQQLYANGTSVTAQRTSPSGLLYFGATSSPMSGETLYIYGPNLVQPTAIRNVNVMGASGASILDNAGTDSLSNSYDGFTVFTSPSVMTGRVAVYGMVK